MPTTEEGLCSFLRVLNNQLMATCLVSKPGTSCCNPWKNLTDTKWPNARLQPSRNRRKRTSQAKLSCWSYLLKILNQFYISKKTTDD